MTTEPTTEPTTAHRIDGSYLVYVAKDAVYVCPLPLLVFRWTREAS